MSDDLREFFRQRQLWAPVQGAGVYLLGYVIAFALPLNIDPLVFGVTCGLAFSIVEMTRMGWRAIDEALQQQRQREDEEWNLAVNAGIGNGDTSNPPGGSARAAFRPSSRLLTIAGNSQFRIASNVCLMIGTTVLFFWQPAGRVWIITKGVVFVVAVVLSWTLLFVDDRVNHAAPPLDLK